MQPNQTASRLLLRMAELLYLFLISTSFYLLFLSRTGEARTVWEVLHPAFLPSLFATTSLLVALVLSSEKSSFKLALTIPHSILIHSLFSIIFPAGDLSGQQMVLGRTRLIYENGVLHGWPPWPVEQIPARVFQFFRGENFQAGLSITLARMINVDLLWVHLALVPLLWGIFTPVAVYLASYTFTRNEKVSALASVVLSAFPYMTYFGAISVPNSLGFIFFFFSLYFILRNMTMESSKNTFLMFSFSFLSFVAHYLTGIMSFSLLLLSLAFKSQQKEKAKSVISRLTVPVTLIASASLLPLALINLRLFRPGTETAFTLTKVLDLPFEEVVGLFAIGELVYGFDAALILVNIIGPIIALLGMTHVLYRTRKESDSNFKTTARFLFTAFLLMLADYRILKLLMTGLPLNEERLWVFRDFIGAPFVALAVFTVVSYSKSLLKLRGSLTTGAVGLKKKWKINSAVMSSLFIALNILIPVFVGGWVTFSLKGAYPQIAPLQTTWYELEAVQYIHSTVDKRYVVIGDIWTIYAGERIAGLNNPKEYYFLENDKIGLDLFLNMKKDPRPALMISAMNLTRTQISFFIVTEPRLGTDEFNTVVSKAKQTGLPLYASFAGGRLFIFYYEK